nr:(E2-independent) E3 ubiquitin-conjugating enzyme FATS isoform X2 [Oryctolagus cuniculus]
MQHSRIPTETQARACAARPAATAVHRAFQIKAFRTELKDHVMLMDLVQSNWLPSQRRAKVCLIHMRAGLTTPEQPASTYEIQSGLLAPGTALPSRGRNEILSNAGLRGQPCSTHDPIAFRNLQSDGAEGKAGVTEGAPESQHTKMISSVVIPQLMHEKESKEDGAALALPCAIARPRACHMKTAPTTRSGVHLHSAFALLPGGTGIPAPSDEPGPRTGLPPRGEARGGGSRRGFASITITARRIGPPAGTLVWGTVGDPPCPKCRVDDALAGGTRPQWRQGPVACTEFSRNGSVARMKVPELQAQLCEGRDSWVTHVDHREDSFSAEATPSGQGPLVFSSCVHFRVSQQCPKSMHYLDKSLFIPIQPPATASPQWHRSVLSLNLNCSSHGLTADGVDGPANGEPRQRAQSLPSPGCNPALQECHLQGSPEGSGQAHLGAGPWTSSLPLENTEFTGAGTDQDTIAKGAEDHAPHRHARGQASQLSIHIPGWSYTAVETKVFSGRSEEQQEARVTLSAPPVEQQLEGDGSLSHDLSEPTARRHQPFLNSTIPLPRFLCPFHDVCTSLQEDNGVQIEREFPTGDYTCCDLVLKIKGCKKSDNATAPEPSLPPPPSPPPPEGPDAPDLSESYLRAQQTPAGSLTLQEALEVRKPQFISRSQERLKKLERMVQQRKAKQKEGLGQQSLLPVRANKKQFTVPHPLSVSSSKALLTAHSRGG